MVICFLHISYKILLLYAAYSFSALFVIRYEQVETGIKEGIYEESSNLAGHCLYPDCRSGSYFLYKIHLAAERWGRPLRKPLRPRKHRQECAMARIAAAEEKRLPPRRRRERPGKLSWMRRQRIPLLWKRKGRVLRHRPSGGNRRMAGGRGRVLRNGLPEEA